MIIDCLSLGAFESNCYIVADEAGGKCMVIDPGAEENVILKRIEELGLTVECIVLTHGHPDHVMAAPGLKTATGARLMMHPGDQELLNNKMLNLMLGLKSRGDVVVDELLAGGRVIQAAGNTFTVMHTPGHSEGSICLVSGDVLFSGDLLFAGGIGRYDLPGGDETKIIHSLGMLLEMDDNIKVYPGHGPQTSIGAERRGNFYIMNLFKEDR
ncbi:MAG: MBL fold metallo-hydrolase [Dehalococcoidaceae bacterium]|nr:MBL fold metallo-hydrolase [Dehalococcoidaceae bacterium]